MDEVLLKQLVRQMKILNFWITFFGTLFLITLLIGGILLFKIVIFVHHTEQSIQNLEQKTSDSLNAQKQICGNDTIKGLLSKTSNYCN